MEKVVTLKEGYQGMFLEAIQLTEHRLLKIIDAVREDQTFFQTSSVEEVDSSHPLSKYGPLKHFLDSVQRALSHGENHSVRAMVMELNTTVRRLDVHLFLGIFKSTIKSSQLSYDISNKSLSMLANFFENNMTAAMLLKGAFLAINLKLTASRKEGFDTLLADTTNYPSLTSFGHQFKVHHVNPLMLDPQAELLVKCFQTFLKLTGNAEDENTTDCLGDSPPRNGMDLASSTWKPSPSTQARLDARSNLCDTISDEDGDCDGDSPFFFCSTLFTFISLPLSHARVFYSERRCSGSGGGGGLGK